MYVCIYIYVIGAQRYLLSGDKTLGGTVVSVEQDGYTAGLGEHSQVIICEGEKEHGYCSMYTSWKCKYSQVIMYGGEKQGHNVQ